MKNGKSFSILLDSITKMDLETQLSFLQIDEFCIASNNRIIFLSFFSSQHKLSIST